MDGYRNLLRRVAALVKPFWVEDKKWTAWGWLLTLLTMLVAINILNVGISFAEREVVTTLQQKQAAEFWLAVVRYAFIMVVIGMPLVSMFGWVKGKLVLSWRDWLTRRMLTKYFGENHFHRINLEADVDHPDQRIQQDITSFCDKLMTIAIAFIDSSLAFVSFITILWLISWKLVVVAVVYSTVGTLLMVFFGKRLIGLHADQERVEADFRRSLIYAQENATSIASYRGTKRELTGVVGKLKSVVGNWTHVLSWQRNLTMFKTSYDYLILVVPMAMAAPLFFSGAIDAGTVAQAGTSFGRVLGALSVIIGLFQLIAEFSANVTRLASFAEALDRQDKPLESTTAKPVIATGNSASGLVIAGMTLMTPGYDRTLVRDLTLSLAPGQRLLICGPSGVGKSSVLKALAGLWVSGVGRIERPALGETIFLPQKPYMPIGSLRDQLTYPGTTNPSDEELLALLDAVNLPELAAQVGGLDTVRPWQEQLSAGEQQRVALARLLLASPKVAILDEATSALDEANEQRLYERITASGISYISVAHRPSLIKHHDLVLELGVGGTWKLLPASEYAVPAKRDPAPQERDAASGEQDAAPGDA